MSKINWIEAQKEYVGDQSMSMAKIGEKYGVGTVSVERYAKKHNWTEQRERTLQRIEDKLPEKISESVTQYNARKFDHGKKVVERAMEILDDRKTRIGGKVANEMVANGYKIQDQAMGIDDPKSVVNIQNNQFISLDDFWKRLDRDIENERTAT
jgi:uncharacterized protein YjcR